MKETKIEIKPISELIKNKFFIPSYQRGYRWTERQVNKLLNDIWEFVNEEKISDEEWYCLQTVIVKKTDDGKWEVIDGLQRLTTIYLILKHLNTQNHLAEEPFELDYETRKGSAQFLEGKLDDDDSNIDYHSISTAYRTIQDWFENKGDLVFDNFINSFLNETKVIWCETTEKNTIDIFTRISIGKTPFTNAELIKALFLNSSNLPTADAEKLRLKQLEIATEWGRIEYALQDNSFWYFINNYENNLPTRIELIFNLMYAEAQMHDKDIVKQFGDDKYSTFLFFNEKFNNTNNNKVDVSEIWQEIKQFFQTLKEWFEDRELYHKISYLITIGVDIKTILNEKDGRSKKEFKIWINQAIKASIKGIAIEKVQYNNKDIRKILLLHNIQTMLNNQNETNRFPFERFNKESWDVEHIHAIATKVKVKQEDQSSWLANNFQMNQHFYMWYNDQIQTIIDENSFVDNELFDELIQYVLGEEDNSLRNLCLLDIGTNRSYKNASFKVKRGKLIDREKKGTFIPICTRNAFMKYYSTEMRDIEVWNNEDKNAYIADINKTLANYLTNQETIENE